MGGWENHGWDSRGHLPRPASPTVSVPLQGLSPDAPVNRGLALSNLSGFEATQPAHEPVSGCLSVRDIAQVPLLTLAPSCL